MHSTSLEGERLDVLASVEAAEDSHRRRRVAPCSSQQRLRRQFVLHPALTFVGSQAQRPVITSRTAIVSTLVLKSPNKAADPPDLWHLGPNSPTKIAASSWTYRTASPARRVVFPLVPLSRAVWQQSCEPAPLRFG